MSKQSFTSLLLKETNSYHLSAETSSDSSDSSSDKEEGIDELVIEEGNHGKLGYQSFMVFGCTNYEYMFGR